ncbi:MAG: GNVR domain-containing protein, partial [Cellulosilyticaceae bacterium]
MEITNAYARAMIEECARVLPVGQLEVIDEAQLPAGPIPSKLPLNTVIGFMLGGMIAMLFILFRMFQEGNTIRSSEQVAQYLGVNVVATIK